MNGMERVDQLQRKQVVKMLMDILKKCYPGENDYLLLRSKQYESMCYTRAATIQHYYQLVSEGFRKIRNAYNGQNPSAPSSAFNTSAGQFTAGTQNAQTLRGATAQGVTHAASIANHVAQPTGNHVYKHANGSNAINQPRPPNPAGPAVPVDPINRGVYHPNLAGVHNPINRQINDIQATDQNYLFNPATPMSQPFSAVDAQLNNFANPSLNQMIHTSAPSVANPGVHPMFNHAGNPVATAIANPSLNVMPSHIPVNTAANPYINPSASQGVNQFIGQINGEIPRQITNQMDNLDQPTSGSPVLMANQMGVTALSPTGIIPRKPHHVPAPIQAPVHETEICQPHSSGVDQFLLSMGMIPESITSGVPTSNANMTGMPMGNSNRTLPMQRKPVDLPSGMPHAQNANRGSRNKLNQAPVSGAQSSLSHPRSATRGSSSGLLSHGKQPVSSSRIGSKRARPAEIAFERSRSKKRNSSIPRINAKETPSTSAQHENLHPASRNAFNSTRSGAVTSSLQHNPMNHIEQAQHKPSGQSQHSPNLEEQLPPPDYSMSERIFISDTIHVSVRQVYNAAASCGYKLTAEKIRSLPKDQVLRIFIRARQMALTKACSLPRGENGNINISKQQLDTLGVEYQTKESTQDRDGTRNANQSGIQNSASQIVQPHSLLANPQMNTTDMFAPTETLHSKACGAQQTNQNAPKGTSRNSVQGPPDHRYSTLAGRSGAGMVRGSSSNGPTISAAQGNGKMSATQHNENAPGARTALPKDALVEKKHGAGIVSNDASQKLPVTTKTASKNVGTAICPQTTQNRRADTRTLRTVAATFSSRLSLFQQKYMVYKNLIDQTLHFLLSKGHEGEKQVLYMRYSMQLLMQPSALGPKLTISLLNTVENFLRDFLVRYKGVPMKPQTEKNNHTNVPRAEVSLPATGKQCMNKSSSAQDSAKNHPKTATNVHSEKDAEITLPDTDQADLPAISGTEKDQLISVVKPQDPKPQDPKPHQSGSPATPSAKPSAPTKPVSDVGIQNTAAASPEAPEENLHSIIAKKLNSVNHSVRMALHMADKCEKNLDQESMLLLKDERISDLSCLLQDDNMKKALHPPEPAHNEAIPERSLLEIVKEECEGSYQKHKKLMINIVERWKKPVVECLLAYQCIRLPKIVIHVGGTYRKDLAATFSFEKPPLGWVPVLADIRNRFMALMDEQDGVSAVLEAWASAAEEVLAEDDGEKK